MKHPVFVAANQVWGNRITEAEICEFIQKLGINVRGDSSTIDTSKKYSNYLEALVGSLDDMVFEISPQGVFLNAWVYDESKLFMPREAFINKVFWDVLPSPLNERLKECFDKVQKEKQPCQVEYELPNGKFFMEARFNIIKNDQQENENISVLVLDISKKKKAEKELQNAVGLASNALKIKSQFLSSINHEIRTPINVISGLANILVQQMPAGESGEFLQAIKESSDKLLSIVNNMLDFTKLDEGQVYYQKLPFHLSGIIEDLYKHFEPKTLKKNISFQYTIDDNVPRAIVGDPLKLKQVLAQLLSNAIKFTESGGIDLHISVMGSQAENVQINFELKDTGIGIPEDAQQNIFNYFTHANTKTARTFGGSGLGLAIIKNIIQQQGGSIQLNSTEGNGAHFSICIPFEKVQLEQNPGASVNDTLLAHLTILVVEDNPFNQLLVKKILDSWKTQYLIANDGMEAVKLLTEKWVDLVLMDLHMPKMGGIEATQMIRSKTGNTLQPDVPIIALTADALPETRIKALKAGMNDYITKPFKKEELYFKILKHIAFFN